MNRTKFAFKNMISGVAGKIIAMVLGFVSRTIFIYCLGKFYLGVNGLYTEILSILSFAELGFGSAMTFAMYKPIAEHDEEKTVQLLNLYRTIYRMIAFIIAVLGLALLPVLQYIVKGAEGLTLFELRIYFILFLTNTVISYFVSYKYSYLNANMKNYIVTRIDMVVNSIISIMQIVVILATRSFFAYLLTHTLLLMVSRYALTLYLNKNYPILKQKPQQNLPKEEKNKIFHEVKGLCVHQFASVAVHSTDNIIISSLSGLGVAAVGLISNYNLLMKSVLGFVVIIFNSTKSGFGNLVASSDQSHFRKVFLEMNFVNFWIYGFCAIAFFILVPPFITLWIGADYLIDNVSFLLIVVNCYLQGQSTMYHNARIAKGNFNKDKWIALVQALVNLIVSIVGAKTVGLVGVYIGTVVSRLVYICARPYSTYKFLFGKSCVEYYIRLIFYFVLTVLVGIVTYTIVGPIVADITVTKFLIAAISVALITNLLFFVMLFWTHEFKSISTRIHGLLTNGRECENGR